MSKVARENVVGLLCFTLICVIVVAADYWMHH